MGNKWLNPSLKDCCWKFETKTLITWDRDFLGSIWQSGWWLFFILTYKKNYFNYSLSAKQWTTWVLYSLSVTRVKLTVWWFSKNIKESHIQLLYSLYLQFNLACSTLCRERIKESCDQLRFLLPSVAGKKSDMASVSY